MSSYLVLARKYRPQIFDELVGQEVLVTTLRNAIKNNRLHHAYILTGIRGVGKTTTARIIAKTINCLNEESRQKAVACGVCDNCVAISNSNHQDVIEIDAASRTGVDDIREIIDSIAYAPVLAKYKIYIIDEVHMLSNNAFNALLKTLEEPPLHVKFIFATTEIKKVPVTILSRCQRFDLRRLASEEILQHLENILVKEEISAQKEALEIIAKVSEGSVRDSLSLLDQALANNNHDKFLLVEVVEKMLGLNDKSKVISLFEHLLKGDFVAAQKLFNEFYAFSSDVSQLLQDLLEITHRVTLSKLVENAKIDGYLSAQKDSILSLSQQAQLSTLTKFWQMFSKAVSEISYATSQKNAFEMLLVRICHLVSLPNLEKILVQLNDSKIAVGENKVAPKNSLVNDEIINEILSSFPNSQVILSENS